MLTKFKSIVVLALFLPLVMTGCARLMPGDGFSNIRANYICEGKYIFCVANKSGINAKYFYTQRNVLLLDANTSRVLGTERINDWGPVFYGNKGAIIPDGDQLVVFKEQSGTLHKSSFSHKGRWQILSVSHDLSKVLFKNKRLFWWNKNKYWMLDLNSGKVDDLDFIDSKITLSALMGGCFSPDDKQIAISDNENCYLINMQSRFCKIINKYPLGNHTNPQFTKDGSLIVMLSEDTIYTTISDGEDWNEIYSIKGTGSLLRYFFTNPHSGEIVFSRYKSREPKDSGTFVINLKGDHISCIFHEWPFICDISADGRMLYLQGRLWERVWLAEKRMDGMEPDRVIFPSSSMP